jgi:hypothetical protein
MNRRRFVGAGFLGVLFGGLASLAGCGDESRQTGTVVETPSDDRKSMEASAAAYKAMEKAKGKPAGQR